MNKVVEKQTDALRETDELKSMLGEIELGVLTRVTLGDLVRLGSKVSGQAYNWTDENENMCALSAGVVAARGLGYIK